MWKMKKKNLIGFLRKAFLLGSFSGIAKAFTKMISREGQEETKNFWNGSRLLPRENLENLYPIQMKIYREMIGDQKMGRRTIIIRQSKVGWTSFKKLMNDQNVE